MTPSLGESVFTAVCDRIPDAGELEISVALIDPKVISLIGRTIETQRGFRKSLEEARTRIEEARDMNYRMATDFNQTCEKCANGDQKNPRGKSTFHVCFLRKAKDGSPGIVSKCATCDTFERRVR